MEDRNGNSQPSTSMQNGPCLSPREMELLDFTGQGQAPGPARLIPRHSGPSSITARFVGHTHTHTPIGVDPAANQIAGNQTAIDTAAIHRKPDPRCRNLKQSVGTQLTARPGKLIPRKRKINETPTTEQGNGSEPIVPLGIGIEDTIAVDFWTTEAVEVAAMFDNVDDAGVDVQQQEEISITPLSQKSDHK
nr:hypothetical protein Iba_chr14aCG9930 [Ipomoea batatas]